MLAARPRRKIRGHEIEVLLDDRDDVEAAAARAIADHERILGELDEQVLGPEDPVARLPRQPAAELEIEVVWGPRMTVRSRDGLERLDRHDAIAADVALGLAHQRIGLAGPLANGGGREQGVADVDLADHRGELAPASGVDVARREHHVRAEMPRAGPSRTHRGELVVDRGGELRTRAIDPARTTGEAEDLAPPVLGGTRHVPDEPMPCRLVGGE
jgi:hypothetical protein